MKLRWDLVALVYVAMAIAGGMLSGWFNGTNPLVHPSPKLVLDPWVRDAVSCGLGLVLGLFVVIITRIAVARASWARRLHEQLRPICTGMGMPTIVLVSLLSSLGEEMFFRSFLCPIVGVPAQALLFGVAHQMPGPSRWIWVAWAGLVGLALGLLYRSVGSLVGPLVAHAFINSVNLLHLRDHDFPTQAPQAGGALGLLLAPRSAAARRSRS